MDTRDADFGEWLRQQLERRDWQQADLLRSGTFTSADVSRWINGRRRPSPASCQRLADVFRLDVDVVLRAGGVAVTWGEFAALRAAIPGLPPAEQNAALRLLIDHVAVDGRVATVAWHAAIRVACGLPEPGPPTP